MSSYPFRYPEQAVLVNVSEIDVSGRVRQIYHDIDGLAESIKTNGLIHPPVINSHFKLIAGGRRMKAMTEVLSLTQVPVMFLETLDDADLALLEAEENARREATTWQEDVMSIVQVHRRKTVAKALNAERWTQEMTGRLLNRGQASISTALTLASYIEKHDKQIMEAPDAKAALRILVERRENEANAALARATVPSMAGLIKPTTDTKGGKDILAELLAQSSSSTDDDLFEKPATPSTSNNFKPAVTGIGLQAARPVELPGQVVASTPEITIPLSAMLRQGDMMNLDTFFGPKYFDHIITDIPYGIDMGNLQQANTGMDVSSTAAEHDVDANIDLMQRMFPVWYAALKDNGYAILWCDVQHWNLLSDSATAAGFKVQRWPLIWYKTHQCLNQAAQYNFTKNYEIAMVLRKGNATLVQPQSSSVWSGSGLNEKDQFGHPFAKPVKLWQWIYDAVATRGQRVLDPFMGSGSALVAGIQRGLQCHGVELNESHYHRAVVNVTNAYQTLTPNVKFV